MAGSVDDIGPIDGLNLDEVERLKQTFKLDESRAALLKAILLGIPVTGIGNKITEDFWLSNILKDIEKGAPMVRSHSLRMLGMYLGILSDKKGQAKKKKVVFDEKDF
jgi:hypothetical protein